jgi:hypothetical protein
VFLGSGAQSAPGQRSAPPELQSALASREFESAIRISEELIALEARRIEPVEFAGLPREMA